MTNAYVVTGRLTSPTTVQLDEPLPLTGGAVRVVVEVPELAAAPKQTLQEYLAALQVRQAARGHVPRSREEIDADLRAERESWE